MAKTRHKAASEEVVGNTHYLLGQIYELTAEDVLDAMKSGEMLTPEQVRMVLAADKFAEKNGITMEKADEQEENPLAKALANIKTHTPKVVPINAKEA